MKSISLDFTNKTTCIMTKGQQGTEYAPELDKTLFYQFIPEKYRDYNSFTWNFEDETFAVNKDYILAPGALYTADNFVPKVILPMKGLSAYYDEFISLMGFEEFSSQEIFDELLIELLSSSILDVDEDFLKDIEEDEEN